MTGELVVSSGFDVAVIEPLSSLADRICQTEFVPKALRGKADATLAAMLTGEELGIKPMTALQKIHVIEGRPGLGAELMRAMIIRAGHDIWIEEKSTTKVTVAGCRRDSDRVQRVTWTADDAKRANLVYKDNWKKYPRAMLTARATAELARDLFPDLIGGLYSIEELQDGGFDEGDVIDIDPETLEVKEPEGHVRSQTKRAPAKTSKRKPTGSITGPSSGSSSKEKDRPPAPPIGGVSVSNGNIIDVRTVEDKEISEGETLAETPSSVGAKAGSIPATDAPSESEETGEIATSKIMEELRSRLARLDDDQALDAFTQEWRKAGIGSVKQNIKNPPGPLLASQVGTFRIILDYAEGEFQAEAFERRRKSANAAMSDIGVKGDKARHELVAEATNGETESTIALTKVQHDAIRAKCQEYAMADGEH